VLTVLFIFLIAFLSTLILTPLVRTMGHHLGIMDIPVELSIHNPPVPRTGGLGMFVGFLMAISYAWTKGLFNNEGRTFIGIVIGAVVICVVGFLDDIHRISPRKKFVWEVLGAAIAIGLGLQVGTFPLLGLGVFLALFYLIGGTNALNLLDGMDGLAAGTTAIAAFFLAILAAGQGKTLILVMALATFGAALGFLPYNFGIYFKFLDFKFAIRNPHSSIFMGDAGSLFLGFMLSSMAILFTAQPYDLVGFITPLVVISIPIVDTALAILRRLASRKDLFTGDRQHVYDLLSKKGLGNRRTVLVIYLATFLLGTLSLVMIRLDPVPAILLAIGIVTIMGIIAIRLGTIRPPASRKRIDE
jgi:UDP-GlcNAc:undecaprenyl-phosphate GlcNAc-1-phosphate transferase